MQARVAASIDHGLFDQDTSQAVCDEDQRTGLILANVQCQKMSMRRMCNPRRTWLRFAAMQFSKSFASCVKRVLLVISAGKELYW